MKTVRSKVHALIFWEIFLPTIKFSNYKKKNSLTSSLKSPLQAMILKIVWWIAPHWWCSQAGHRANHGSEEFQTDLLIKIFNIWNIIRISFRRFWPNFLKVHLVTLGKTLAIGSTLSSGSSCIMLATWFSENVMLSTWFWEAACARKYDSTQTV